MRPGTRELLRLEALYNARGQQRGGVLTELPDADPASEPLRLAWRERSFQTQPVLAGYLLARTAGRSAEEWERLRARLAPLFGAIGDRLVFGALIPAVRLMAIAAALTLLGPVGAWGAGDRLTPWFLLPAGLLVAFALLGEQYWRDRGLRVGRGDDAALAREIAVKPWDRWIAALHSAARLALGIGIGLVAANGAKAEDWIGLLALGLGLLGGWLLSRRARPTPTALVWAALVLGVICGIVAWSVGASVAPDTSLPGAETGGGGH